MANMDEQISKWYADKAKLATDLQEAIRHVRSLNTLDVAYQRMYNEIVKKLETRLEHARYMGD